MMNIDMNMNKNKKIKVISDDYLKRQYSSLSVNLTCASNLTDSGNESLKQTDQLKPCLSRSKNIYHTRSCTVNGINKNPCLTNVSLDVLRESVFSRKTRNYETDNFIASKDQSLSVSNISKYEDTFTATPIACSTMIDENAEIFDMQDELLFQDKNNLSSHSNVHRRNHIISMEITDVCGRHILCNKSKTSIKCIAKDASKNCLQIRTLNKCSSASVESLRIDSNEGLLNKTSKKFIKFTTVNKDTEQNTNMQWNSTDTETDSADTVETSLNVNTSMDLISQSNKSTDKSNEKSERKICKNFRNKYKEDINLAASEEAQESINTVCTSLQMNTSLNTSNMLEEISCTNKTSELRNAENEKKDTTKYNATMINMYSTKDANLSKDFINILTLRNMNNCFNNQNIKNKEKDKINSTAINNQYKQVIDKIHSNEQSYIKATPHPMCSSIMLRSQLKQNTVAYSFQNNGHQFNNNKNDIHHEAKSGFLKKKIPTVSINLSEGQEEMKNNTVTLNSSSYKRSNTKTEASVIMKEMTNENKLDDINTQKVDKKKCKRKLMPLRECSQLSFSPVEKQYLPPRCLIFRKNIKNKCKKVNVNSVEHDKREKKKDSNEKKTKGKKPRKVISKKIIVKKIVNQDILKKLLEDRENLNKTQINTHSSSTNLSNDFQSFKEPSTTQFIRKKAHRINIVTTGLSNEDKIMVKSVVQALGSARIESVVTKRTTHIVTTGVRTINLLHGIIRGCWLVGLEWVLKSLESNAWLNPEEYEMTHFSKAVLENRKDRQLFGSSYVPELFATCGYIYIEKNTTPPYNVLKDLIKVAGGCTTENPEIAKTIIGTKGLKETWVLDCITSGELQPYNQYRRY